MQPHVAGEGLVVHVRRLLEASAAAPDVCTMARTLRTSGRSLCRALRNVGTSYQEIVD